jgi:predicted phage-related endonuclease
MGEQGSIEWLMDRVGHCTASRFADVMDFTGKGAPGAKRKDYMLELVGERLTGKPAEKFVSNAMLHGTEYEPFAVMAYESLTGQMCEEAPFVRHPSIEWVGCSPDRLIGEDGGLECKCPTTPTHLTTMLTGECLHLPQIHGCMWITGRQWWDFASYDPRMPDGLQLYMQRVERDDEYIGKLSGAVIQFLAEVDEMVGRLQGMGVKS